MRTSIGTQSQSQSLYCIGKNYLNHPKSGHFFKSLLLLLLFSFSSQLVYSQCGGFTVGNFIWFDEDKNGIQDSGEPGIEGVQLILRANGTTNVDTTISDVNGIFSLCAPSSGNYDILINVSGLPPAYQNKFEGTIQDAGTDEGKDSDLQQGVFSTILLSSLFNVDADLTNIDLGLTCNLTVNVGGAIEICEGQNITLQTNAFTSDLLFEWYNSTDPMNPIFITSQVDNQGELNVSPTQTTIYEVVVTDTIDANKNIFCVATDMVKVRVRTGATRFQCDLLDDFSSPRGRIVTVTPFDTFDDFTSTGPFGGQRYVELEHLNSFNEAFVDFPPFPFPSAYSHSNGDGALTRSQLCYRNLNYNMQMFKDNEGFLRLRDIIIDQSGVNLTITIRSGGNTATISRFLPPSFTPYDEEFDITSFANIDNVDLTNVNEICFDFLMANISVDFNFKLIEICKFTTCELGGEEKICLGESFTFNNDLFPDCELGQNWTIEWDQGITHGQTITPSPAGLFTYHVTITDEQGCESTGEYLLTVCDTASINPPDDFQICFGDKTDLVFNISNFNGQFLTKPLTYQLKIGNNVIKSGDVTSNTLTIQNLMPLVTTTYTLMITADDGCMGSSSVTVIVNDLPDPTIDGILEYCENDMTELCAGPLNQGFPVTYSWSKDGNNLNLDTRCIDVTMPGSYSVTVTRTDTNPNCPASDTVQVVENPNPVIDSLTAFPPIICEGNSTKLTAFVSGGTGSKLIEWFSDQNKTIKIGQGMMITVSPLYNDGKPTCYYVKVTDTKGCMAMGQVCVDVVQNTLELSISKTDENCGLKDGTATANPTGGMTPPFPDYKYIWNTGDTTKTITGLMAGTYTVTVTDEAGCDISKSVTINNVGGPTVTASPDVTICSGESVQLTSSATGGTPTYSYFWSPSDSLSSTTVQNPIANPTQTTIYTVEVTDSNNPPCTDIDQVKVTVIQTPGEPTANDVQICEGDQATLSASCSSGEVQWYDQDVGGNLLETGSPFITPILTSPDTFYVSCKFGRCESARVAVVVTFYDNPVANASNNGPVTCNEPNATLNGTGSSIGLDIKYLWTKLSGSGNIVGDTNQILATVNGPGFFKLTVTDMSTGCMAMDTTEVLIDDNTPEAFASNDGPITCVDTEVKLDGTGSSTGGNIKYEWKKVQGAGVITGPIDQDTTTVNGPGIFKIIVTNTDNGCTAEDTTLVGIDTISPVILLSQDPTICEGEKATLTVSTDPSYDIEWNTGEMTSSIMVMPASTTSYSVTVTNPRNGCTAMGSIEVTVEEKGTIGDRAWDDVNGNGCQDIGELGINGVKVYLLDENMSVIDSTLTATGTNGPGFYEFDVCPGDYFIQFGEVLGFGFTEKDAAACGNDISDSDANANGKTDMITIGPGQDNPNVDAGYRRPLIEHDKEFKSVTQLTNGSFNVVYEILVENKGGASGFYGLRDQPKFDTDVVIISATYSTDPDIGNNTFFTPGPWTLANNQLIGGGATHKYILTVNVNVSLSVGDGGNDVNDDNVYTPCQYIPGTDIPIEFTGLYNESLLDTNNDGQPDEVKKDCGDIAVIGDYVWADLNEDGIQNDGPTGINGVTVNLYEGGNLIATTTTATGPGGNDGYYVFPVDAGTYVVEFVKATGEVFTVPNAAGDLVDSDANQTTGRTGPITVALGDIDMTNDAGLVPEYEHFKEVLGVSQDNNTGIFTVSYKITVKNLSRFEGKYDLDDDADYDDDALIVSAEFDGPQGNNIPLDNSGFWTLATGAELGGGLMHMYTLRVEVQIDLSGDDQTGDNIWDLCEEDIRTGDPLSGNGLFNQSLLDTDRDGTPDDSSKVCEDIAVIGDYVWADLNEDGIQNDGPTGINGVTVNLYEGGNLIATTTTTTAPAGLGGNDGYYAFAVDAGTYVVEFLNATGESFTIENATGEALDSDANQTTGRTGPITVALGDIDMTNDAGLIPGYRHEKEVLGVSQDNNTGIFTVSYKITVKNLSQFAGKYNLKDEANYDDDALIVSAEFDGPQGNNIPLDNSGFWTLATGAELGGGLMHMYTLRVEVQIDLSGDDQTGDNIWDLCEEDIRTGDPLSGNGLFNQSLLDTDRDGTPDDSSKVCEDIAVIGDYVWADLNEDGIQNDGPTGINGVTVNLYEGGNLIATTTTTTAPAGLGGNDGYYAFAVDAGTYVVEFLNATGESFTIENATGEALDSDANQTTGRTGPITVALGDIDMTNDAGLIPGYRHEKEVLSVSQDNNTGVFTVSYKITVENLSQFAGKYNLKDDADYDDDALIVSAEFDGPQGNNIPLDNSGFWTLATGAELGGGLMHMYTLRVEVQIDLSGDDQTGDNIWDLCEEDIRTGDPLSGNGLFNQSLLDTDRDGTPDDSSKVCEDIAVIGDYVWADLNEDGIQNDGPTGINGVTVNLYEGGNLIATTTTTTAPAGLGGNDGYYAFAVDAGTYVVEFLNATGESFTIENATGEALDSDANQTTGRTGPITVALGDIDMTNDAGLVPEYEHFKEVLGVSQDNNTGIFTVSYKITVKNLSRFEGKYDLDDDADYDDDALIVSAEFDGPQGNNIPLDNSGFWTLATGAELGGGLMHMYTLRVEVQIDLSGDDQTGDNIWDLCEEDIRTGDPLSGNGLFNQSLLDTDRDGTPDDSSKVCEDIAVIGDYVWADLNEDGIQNDGPTGINGVTVNLYEGGNLIATTTTTTAPAGLGGNDGYYAFAVDAGTYVVEFLNATGESFTIENATGEALDSDANQTTGRTGPITVALGDIDMTNDAGLIPGYRHEKEVLSVSQDNNTGVFTVSYKITVENLSQFAGKYNLKDDADYDDDALIVSAEFDGPQGNNIPLDNSGFWTLATGAELGGGLMHMYTLRVEVQIDLSGDDQTGDNIWDLCEEDIRTGDPLSGNGLFNQSLLDTDRDGTPDDSSKVCEDIAVIGDYVWADLNEDGIQNDGPTGINGVTVNLYEGGNLIATTTTTTAPAGLGGNDGYYAFAVDAGTYVVEFLNATGESFTIENATGEALDSDANQTTGRTGPITVALGDIDMTNDAGLIPGYEHFKEVLGVSQDNNTGIFTVSYKITVKNLSRFEGKYDLDDDADYDDDALIVSAEFDGPQGNNIPLDNSGFWTLATGAELGGGLMHMYTLRVEVQIDLSGDDQTGDNIWDLCEEDIRTGDPLSGNGLFNQSLLDTDRDGTPDDSSKVCEDIAVIGDYVWADLNEDGIQNDGPTGINGVTVNLYEGGNLIATTTTTTAPAGLGGNDGYYVFAVDAGTYVVEFLNATGESFTIENATGEALDSDANQTTGRTGPITVALGDIDMTNDAGLVPEYEHFKEVLGVSQDNNTGIFTVSYKITVKNLSRFEGKYDLDDDADYDDDALIVSAEFDGPQGNNIPLDNSGFWTLATGAELGGGLMHMYTLRVEVQIDLSGDDQTGDNIWDLCEEDIRTGDPLSGNGLFNQSLLDTDRDGTPDDSSKVCEDIAVIGDYVWADLNEDGIQNDGPTGINGVTVNLYEGGNLIATTTTTTAPAGLGGNDGYYAFAVDAGTYVVEFLNATGESFTIENATGEALDSDANQTTGRTGPITVALGDIDMTNDAGLVPEYEHFKEVLGVSQDNNTGIFTVSYKITVKNLSRFEGKYDLDDDADYDDDALIVSAEFDGPQGNNIPLDNSGFWTLATGAELGGGLMHMYTLRVEVQIDLSGDDQTGDNIWDLCEEDIRTGDPLSGNGLFNQSLLDTDRDGTPDDSSKVCEDIAVIGDYVWADLNEDGIQNDGPTGINGVTVNLYEGGNLIATTTTTTAPAGLGGNDGYYAFAVDAGTYVVEFLNATGESFTIENATGEALDSDANQTTGRTGPITVALGDIDMTNDAGLVPEYDHEKEIISIILQNDGSFNVLYEIIVRNKSRFPGKYNLKDEPKFDNDVDIVFAEFTGPFGGPNGLSNTGPWTLANDRMINGGQLDTYTLLVNVTASVDEGDTVGDNTYNPCEIDERTQEPLPDRGLFNQSLLDKNRDQIADDTSKVCGDIPIIVLDKQYIGFTPEGSDFLVEYKITVENKGGAIGFYDLYDEPFFDNDVEVLGAGYTTSPNIGSNPNLVLQGGKWKLADDQGIDEGVVHMYTLKVKVGVDLEDGIGDNRYDDCNSNNDPFSIGKGLFNQAQLDLYGDPTPDKTDEDCGDVPVITHEKEFIIAIPNGAGFTAIYSIIVRNDGGVEGRYDLDDQPYFDDDITITGGSYQTFNVPGNNGGSLVGNGPWPLANNQLIAKGAVHTYQLLVGITVDLNDSQGDNDYTDCFETTLPPSQKGRGLFNESRLYLDDDNIPDEIDDDCGDIPVIEVEKDYIGFTPMGSDFEVEYKITVENKGGALGEYDLYDEPFFDNDVQILSASYTTSPNIGSGNLFLQSGRWKLANDQNIDEGVVHMYTLRVKISVDLDGGGGDNRYDDCNSNNDPFRVGKGLFNQAQLDLDDDGQPDKTDEDCGDVPVIDHEKTFIIAYRDGNGEYVAEYEIKVRNRGGATGDYNLEDQPFFDNDISINSAGYTSDAPGNGGGNLLPVSGPWQLATDQDIDAGDMHLYKLTVRMDLNLNDGVGDDVYTPCQTIFGGEFQKYTGLFNESRLDLDDEEGPEEIDEDCGDLPAKLGNYVWEDIDGDGLQDGNEPGIGGTKLYLTDANGNLVYNIFGVEIGLQYTDANGFYEFNNLLPGQYKVNIIWPLINELLAPTQMNASGGFGDFSDAGDDSDFMFVSDILLMSHVVTLSQGECEERVDAGFSEYATIGDYVWEDLDGNGLQDGNEPGITGVEVSITDEFGNPVRDIYGNIQDPVITGGLGDYTFHYLPTGEYKITFDLPQGYAFTQEDVTGGDTDANDAGNDNDADPITGMTEVYFLSSGERETRADAGIVRIARIGDYAWNDENGNGLQDQGEPGLGGVTVSLTDAQGNPVNDVYGNEVVDVLTAGNGFYMFDDLLPGDYKVSFTAPAGYDYTTADVAGNDNDGNDINRDSDAAGAMGMSHVISIQSGEVDFRIDAGFILPSRIGDYVWRDSDADGIQDNNEDGVNGIEVILYGDNDQNGIPDGPALQSTVTSGDGDYEFEVPPGKYVIKFVAPEGTMLSPQFATGPSTDSDPDPNTGYTFPIVVGSGENRNDLDAGLFNLLTLGDLVWRDEDNDGQFDAGSEQGIQNVTLRLWKDDNGNDIPDFGEDTGSTAITNSSGKYQFDDLLPGDYIVQIESSNFGQGNPLFEHFTSTGNDPVSDPDNNVDGDDNGFDSGNTGIISLAITLSDGAEPVNDGDSDNATNLSLDFGFYPAASIGDFVWNDSNGNGTQDNAETGINGVTVFLLADPDGDGIPSPGILQSTITSNNPADGQAGYYEFTGLETGNYIVQFVHPNGLIATVPKQGNDVIDSDADSDTGLTGTITLLPGEEQNDIDAGFYVPAKLGNFVWQDENEDNVQSGDPGFFDIQVDLYVIANNIESFYASTTTNEEGYYLFDNLPTGIYRLVFHQPGGWSFVTPNMGGDEAMDSDVTDLMSGSTSTITLSPGDFNSDVDAGLQTAALPIELLSFEGSYNNARDIVELSWTTANEINSDYYIVERSFGSASEFASIGRVAAKGNSNTLESYGYEDVDIARSGDYFYRLKMVDQDGSYEYSEVIQIDIQRRRVETTVSLYPNPTVELVNIDIRTEDTDNVQLYMFDVAGKKVAVQTQVMDRTERELSLMLDVSHLARGTYIIRMQMNTEVITKPLVLVY